MSGQKFVQCAVFVSQTQHLSMHVPLIMRVLLHYTSSIIQYYQHTSNHYTPQAFILRLFYDLNYF